jgi:hypothetical protein
MLGGVPGWEEFQVGRSSRLGGVPGWEEFQVGRSSRLGWVDLGKTSAWASGTWDGNGRNTASLCSWCCDGSVSLLGC